VTFTHRREWEPFLVTLKKERKIQLWRDGAMQAEGFLNRRKARTKLGAVYQTCIDKILLTSALYAGGKELLVVLKGGKPKGIERGKKKGAEDGPVVCERSSLLSGQRKSMGLRATTVVGPWEKRQTSGNSE